MNRYLITAFFTSLPFFIHAQVDTGFYHRFCDTMRVIRAMEFGDPELSPLPAGQIPTFKGLHYFPYNSSFIVEAHLLKTPGEKPFKLHTASSRLRECYKYGEAHFRIGTDTFALNLYRLSDLSDYADTNHLYLPFTDNCSGFDTYIGGRYLDLSIPDGDTLVIDFNFAYNPYCAYNPGYSYAPAPKENHLNIRVEAGVLYKP